MPELSVEVDDELRGGYVPVGTGSAIWSPFVARITGLPFDVSIRVVITRGRPVVDELLVSRRRGSASGGSAGVTTDGLRQVAPTRLLRLALDRARVGRVDRPDLGPGVFQVPSANQPETAWGGGRAGPGRGKPMDDDHLRRVAEVYREAVLLGLPPTDAVRNELSASRSTAGRWVMQARAAGFLGPAIRRSAGEADVQLDPAGGRPQTRRTK